MPDLATEKERVANLFKKEEKRRRAFMAVNPLIDRFPRAQVDYTKRHDRWIVTTMAVVYFHRVCTIPPMKVMGCFDII